jgi:hypothetical protein
MSPPRGVPVSDMLGAALSYASQGRRVFPVALDKRPLTEHGFKDATTDEAPVRAWWARWPDAGIATPTGPDWFVLDVDDPQALATLEAEHGHLPPTVEVVTPRPGLHLHLRGEGVTTSRGNLPAGIDVRGNGGYVLLPPSPHVNGVYEWRQAPDEIEMAVASPWLMLKLAGGASENGGAPTVEGDIPNLQRNTTLASMAGTMRRRGFHEAAIADALLATNRDRCKPPLEEQKVRDIARSIARYDPAEKLGTVEGLTGLLGLDTVDKRIDAIKIFGRGSDASAYITLDDSTRIVLDPIGRFTTAPKLTAELALQAGAAPVLKGVDVTRALVMLHDLAEHTAAVDVSDRALDMGSGYLDAAPVHAVRMGDQAERWRAFDVLAQLDPTSRPGSALEAARSSLVLKDVESGVRYVRVEWFGAYVRRLSGAEERAVLRQMTHLGWGKPGNEGRIKATAPARKAERQWAFYTVPKGWPL